MIGMVVFADNLMCLQVPLGDFVTGMIWCQNTLETKSKR